MPGWKELEEILHPKDKHKKDLEWMFRCGVITGLVAGILMGGSLMYLFMMTHQ
jgi:hypothetical protein